MITIKNKKHVTSARLGELNLGDWFMNDGDPCVVVSKTAFGEISAVLFNDACKSPQLVVRHDYQKVTPLAKVDVTVEVKG